MKRSEEAKKRRSEEAKKRIEVFHIGYDIDTLLLSNHY